MTAKPKLLLHVGTHKTATSSIQSLLEENRPELERQGFCYPATDRPPFPNLPKHTSLYTALMGGPDAIRVERDHIMRAFEASGCNTLVLSEEGLSSPGFLKRNAMAGIALLAPEFDVKIVSFQRRQDYFVESLWNQFSRENTTQKHITDFVVSENPVIYMTYKDTLDAWGQFGSVVALGYEASVESGIVQAFLAVTGIVLQAVEERRNVSPSMSCAALIAKLNSMNARYDWRKIEALLGTGTRRYALGSRLRGEILARFAEHNAQLREAYGVTFPDSMPTEPEDPIAEPDAAEVARVVAALGQGSEVPRKNPARPGRAKKAGSPAPAPAAPLKAALAAPSRTGTKKPRLILHVGTHTTANGALQAVLAKNRKPLADQGFHYARTNRQPVPHKHKHAFLAPLLAKGGPLFRAWHNSVMAEFAASGSHTLVLSEEGLSGPGPSKDLAPMALFAEDFELEVICYLRRQDDFAEAFWNYRCKTGSEVDTISDFVARPPIARHMNYNDMLARWSAIAKVSAFDFASQGEAGVVASFATATGMVLPSVKTQGPPGPSMTLAAALAVLNRDKVSHDWRQLEPLIGPAKSGHALGSRLRADLLARYADSNEMLSTTFGVRFSDEMPAEPVAPIADPGPDLIARLRRSLEAGAEADAPHRSSAVGAVSL